MDRCALFVDAGYVLADGGMAVHGTRRRDSVSWDYEGLLHILASLATERTGLPLLRCYWYEATVEGRRSADHDALADLPGVKLRLAKMRPGRREGVESEIHRDLETLARNKAVSDAVVVSADEDLAEVVASVQDLGMRVTLLHIAVDADWTISRALRQECDDIVEISSELLRPYAELISGAEPPHADDQASGPLVALRPPVNGHGQGTRTTAWAPLPVAQENGHQPPGYDEPAARDTELGQREPRTVSADVTPPAAEVPAAMADASAVDSEAAPVVHEIAPVLHEAAVLQEAGPVPHEAGLVPHEAGPVLQEAGPVLQEAGPVVRDLHVMPDAQPGWHEVAAGPLESQPVQELYAAPIVLPAPVAAAAPAEDPPLDLPVARAWQPADMSGYNPGAAREQFSRDASIREPLRREPLPGEPGDGMHPVPAAHAVPAAPAAHAVPAGQGSAQIRRLPTRGNGFPPPPVPQAPQSLPPSQPPYAPGQPGQSQPGQLQPGGQPTSVQPVLSAPTAVPPGIGQPGPGYPATPGPGYTPSRNGNSGMPGIPTPPGHGGPVGPSGPGAPVGQPSLYGPVYTPAHGINGGPAGPSGPVGPVGPVGPAAFPSGHPSVSLGDAVQSAHDEGQEFGSSVARDAPALWLEAVLARKPRMPSDLEARLLQGSALPIDFLLHDEVRHALRRGFWDALERARR